MASSPTLAPYLCGLGAAPGRGSFGVEADRRTGHPEKGTYRKVVFKSWENHWMSSNEMLGGGFKYFLFSPLLGEMIQFD